MRVAVVSIYPENPARVGGGVSGAAKYLIDELKKEPGVEVVVVVPKSGTGAILREEDDGVAVYRVGKRRGWSLLPGTLYDLCVGRRQIREVLAGIRPDIVHFQGETFLAAGCPWPSVLTIHGIGERDAFFDRLRGSLWRLQWLLLKLTEEYARKRTPHVILISDYVGSVLPAMSGPRRTWRINNAIASSFFDVRRMPQAGRVLCCCRVFPLKNVVNLIAAFADVVRALPEAELRIAGGNYPAYQRECEREAEARGISGKVRFLGNLGIEEIQDELSKAACLALVSLQENAPLSIEEAMAAGVPVVASNVGGIPEMVEHERSGLLVDPRSTGEIAGALIAVLSDGARAAAMGARGRRIAEERFRPSAVAKLTLSAYAEILAREPRAS